MQTTWDADSVMAIDLEEYRTLYPYPYFHFLPAIGNLVDRPDLIAPLHLFKNVLLFAIFFGFLRFFMVRFVFKPFARYLCLIEDDYELFAESGMQMLYYASTWAVSAAFLAREDWFWDSFYVFEGNFPNQPMGDEYYWIMACHMGWYSFGLLAHLFIDVPKKDYWEMLTHHVVTLALLYFAFVKGYYRFVMLTLFCHDICDVFLHCMKMGKYVDNVRTMPDIVQIPVFIPLPVSWVVFRLFLFPRMVIYNCLIQCPLIVGIETCSYYWVYNPLLIILYILQVYWFYLIMKIAYKKLSGKGTFADIREGSDKTGKLNRKQKMN